MAAGGISCDLSGENWRYPDLHIPLLGRHQAENGATALGAVELLRQHGFTIGEGDVRQGLARLRWPGRMEVIPGKPLFLLDVAHNPDGARVLRAAMGSHFPGRWVVMVFGALADKDVAAMAAQLTPPGRCGHCHPAREPQGPGTRGGGCPFPGTGAHCPGRRGDTGSPGPGPGICGAGGYYPGLRFILPGGVGPGIYLEWFGRPKMS